jgi:hypothetical protein
MSDNDTMATNEEYERRGKTFRFGDHVCAEAIIAADEKRTGRLVQVRIGAGAFGSDIYLIRLRDGILMSFENVSLRHADDKEFEKSFYLLRDDEPPVIPDQEMLDQDTEETEYSIIDNYPETGFIIHEPLQPNSSLQSFGMTITNG